MADSSINYTSLDFESIKSNLKDYLKSQDIFKDYDFEASNMNVLLDILAYNTNLNGFYLNMIGNEMFLDSALLRDSIISHAKELNYLPRSFRSATAVVNLTLTDTTQGSISIPRGTAFTGSDGNKSFTFVTAENLLTTSDPDVANKFYANNVTIYEGDYISDSFVVDYQNEERFVVSNKNVDTNSIFVVVIEDNGATSLTYKFTDSLFDLDSRSQVFFLQPAENESYEVVFGDGVIGRRPKDRSVILIQYRACNGELPNGIQRFSADGAIGTSTVTDVATVNRASGGSVSESLSSIKFNAPRAFTTQERVVTADDYKSILLRNFSEINDISAYGGEESVPPLFGKVIVAVDLKTTDKLPPSKSQEYKNFVKRRSPLSIDPVFVEPEYTYVKVETTVKYNINQTSLTSDDVGALVKSAVQNYNLTNINGFRKTLFYSNLVSTIDFSQLSIVSNDTEVFAIKTLVPEVRTIKNYDIDFGLALRDDIGQKVAEHDSGDISIVKSTPFIFNNETVFIEDDGEGLLRIMQDIGENHRIVKFIGTVDYNTGILKIQSLEVQTLIDNKIDFIARTRDRDITAQRKTILSIRDDDISIKVEQVRI
jgi:hypothetical protein